MSDWQVHIDDDWQMNAQRLVIYRRVGDRTEIIISYDNEGVAVVTSVPPGVASDFRGFIVPRGALNAIAEHIKPGPSQGELARLEEALTLERRRVDDALAVFTGLPPMRTISP